MRSYSSKYNFYPILIITLCAAFLFFKYVLQVYPSIITHQLMLAFNLDGFSLGNLAATFYYTYVIAQLFSGVIIDHFSPRWLTSFAILLSALGLLLFSEVHTLTMALISRGLMGAGVAFATVAYLKFASLWVSKERYALVSGLLATAAMAGAVFGQGPLSFLIESLGWRTGLFYTACVGILLAFLFAVLVRDRKPLADSAKPRESMHLHEILAIFKNKQNWLLSIYSGLAFSPVAVLGGLWGNPFLEEAYHLSSPEAASIVSLIFIGVGLGSPILGVVANRIGNPQKVLLASTTIACIALTAIIYLLPPLWLTGTLLFICGFSLGAFMLAYAIGKESNAPKYTGSVIAMINTTDAILGALTEPFIGKFLDLSFTGQWVNGVRYFSVHNYQMALMVMPIYLILAIVILFWIKNPEMG